jgi:5-methylcytosine-specific restriction endonuclease McrA
LPTIRGEFAAARLSYAKVRALTRIATPDTEAGLAEMAGPMTGNQLERFARAHRTVTEADDAQTRVRRRLVWRWEDDGSLAGTFRLPPLEGAALLKALRAATDDLEHPHVGADSVAVPDAGTPDANAQDVSAETAAASAPEGGAGASEVSPTSSGLADGLVTVAEAFLAGKVRAADNPDVYQVIVHVGTDALGASAQDVSAETLDANAQTPVPGRPADPARRHVEDGPAISVTTADMLTCGTTLSWLLHDHDGTLLDAGRRHRKPTAALRRAVRERDQSRCQYPGCDSRRVDLHHIRYWSNGGATRLANLICLCKAHHRMVHDHGYRIVTGFAGTFTFCRPDGTPIPVSPALPETAGRIEDCHDADIEPGTIIPPWYGERLNLDYAIATCFANAENQARKQAGQPSARPAETWRPTISDVYAPDALDELRAIRV